MTLKENIMKLQTYKMFEGEDTLYVERDDVLKLLEQEPCNHPDRCHECNKILTCTYYKQEQCEKVAQERYADLCEYFGGAKDILKNRKDFKAWLERVKWHIHKAEELYEKYEYKKEPYEDCISRQAVLDTISEWKQGMNLYRLIRAIPSAEPYKGMTNGEVIKAMFPDIPRTLEWHIQNVTDDDW